MRRQSLIAAATLAALAAEAMAGSTSTPLPSMASDAMVLPIKSRCSMRLGSDLTSTIGPVEGELSYDAKGSSLRITRDGMAGHGENQGEARLSGGSRTLTVDFHRSVGDGRFTFAVSSEGDALLDFLAGVSALSIAPLTDRADHDLGDVPAMLTGSAPRFTLQLGSVAPQIAQLGQCGEILAIARKVTFCVKVTVFQANQGCPVASWRMASEDERQVDWIDENHVKRDSEEIGFGVFSQRGSTANIHTPEDRTSTIRLVSGDCRASSYRSVMLIDDSVDGINVSLDQPEGSDDRLVSQDLAIACKMDWRSAATLKPTQETELHFDSERVRLTQRRYRR